MKKGNRILALFLAVILMVTGIAWDFSNTMVANADDTATNTASTESAQPEKINFDNIDVSTLTDFTSTQLNSSTYALIGAAGQSAGNHWFSGAENPDKSSTNSGLKPKTIRNNNKHNLLQYKDSYGNFKLTAQVYWNTNVGIVIGAENTYPLATTTNAILIATNTGNLRVRGAIDESTAKVTGTRKYLNTSTKNQCVFGISSSSSVNLDGTTQTINVKLQDGVLTVWVDGYNEVLTVNVTSTYPKESNITLWAMGYDNKIGFKSFRIRDLDAVGYTDFDNADVSTLTDFASTQLNSSNNALVGTAGQAVSNHWLTGLVNPDNSKTNFGLKPKTIRSNNRYNLMNYKQAYEDFQVKVDVCWNTNVGIVIGAKNTYALASTTDAILIATNTGNLRVRGAIDESTATVTGTRKYLNTSTSHQCVFGISSSSSVNLDGTIQSINIRMQDGVLTVWVDGYNEVLTVNVSSTYPAESYISLWAMGYNNKIGFQGLQIQELGAEIVGFDNADVTTLTDFTSTQLDSNNYALVGEKDQPAQNHWFTGLVNPDNSKTNSGLKPKTKRNNNRHNLLAYKDTYENFELKVDVSWNTNTGIVIGAKNKYALNTTTDAILIATNTSNLRVRGAVDESTATVTGTRKYLDTKTSNQCVFGIASSNLDGTTQTIHVKMLDGVLKVWVEGYDEVLTVNVTSTYPIDSNITLWAMGYDNKIGFHSFSIRELESEFVKEPAVQAQPGEGFSEEFIPLNADFTVKSLNKEFSSYYFASSTATGERGKVSDRWNYSNKTGEGLKPKHNGQSGARTMLTYDKLIFKNVEVTTKYAINWVDYSVMIAPEGQMASVANNGIKAWVESDGKIRVTGAIDAGTASATGGYVQALGQNMIRGYKIDGYSGKRVDGYYTLHVKIDNGMLYIWMDEIPEYVISVKVTEDYQGGLVSLYSTGNNSGGFGAFSAVELTATTPTTPSYEQSFNTIDSLDELTDFTAYKLDSVENKPQEVEIADIFRLKSGRLQSMSAANGKEDKTNFSILTLNKKQYKNFELTLKYEQARMQRYGIMFGEELGEFAYSQKGSRLVGNGGVYAYTEAEGYRNLRGSVHSSSFTDFAKALCRKNSKLDSFWWINNTEVMNTVQQKSLHTMTIRVVGDSMTMIIDNDEASRVTVRLDDYTGGYISLVSDAAGGDYGAFTYLAITELDEDAKLETTLPELPEGFGTMKEVDKLFDAYYLTDAKESSKLEKVELKDRWWLNQQGYVSRTESASGYSVTDDIDVLTYTKQKFTDFELTFTYQQNWNRMGVLIGEELGEYPLSYENGKISADRGVVYFAEAEGYQNVQGYLNNWTKTDERLYRVSKFAPEGFKDGTGSVTSNISAKKEHLVKIVVKDKQLYVFIDGNEEEAALHVFLGDDYKGGSVSLFSHTGRAYGFNNFSITDKVTTKLPAGKGTSSSGNTYTVDFDTTKLDISAFKTYYLDHTKGNATGKMKEDTFENQWTLDNGVLESNTQLTTPSAKNLTEFEWDDSTMVSVLTYDKKLTDFVVSYDYKKTWYRSMFMFGTEMGEFALAAPNTTQKGQGVLIYPENDLGASGGIVALGSLATYTNEMRPMNRTLVQVEGYHEKGNWNSNVGSWHTMTVAVISGHCYIYLDDYGLVADYELADYKGGYISLATSGRNYQYFGVNFDNLRITDLSDMAADSVVAGQNPNDVTVLVGTDASALNLPTSVKATLKNGTSVMLPVKWESLNYNPSEAGVYQFTAILDDKTNVGVKINVRVVTEMPKTQSGVKYWTFDTEDDLKDFKAYYLKNAETGYITEGAPNWYVNSSGKLTRDPFRAVNGDQYKEIAILTYTGEKYTNFELEVEYTQQWQRMMVLFGSEKAGQYIDLKDIYAASNPVAGFVEMEGVRNFIGNLINANFDSNDKEKINNARESGIRLENYYDKVLYGGNQGKKHTMKIRVVGDQAMMWVDNCEVPYVCTLTNYDGGYISLVATSKSGSFDNLKITRLGATPEEAVKEPNAVANGTMNVSIDATAPAELEVPERMKPDSYEDVSLEGQSKLVIPTIGYVIGGSTILLAIIIGGLFILAALKKKKKES